MNQSTYSAIITDQTKRALWEAKNIITCIPAELWDKKYCGMPMWKHVYHMLHSLDLWFINPRDPNYIEPSIHTKDLNNLDVISDLELTRQEINQYLSRIEPKIKSYLKQLKSEDLLAYPENCEYTRFTLIMAQHRHLHSHMGMIMGFIIDDTGLWPRVLGLENEIPTGNYEPYC
ncbi:MAG: hypothetical protein ACRDBO_08325 [Lachnospiraceae bacterium]